MQITILAVGKKMPSWVEMGVATYQQRLPREYRLRLLEIAQSRDNEASKRVQAEGKQLLAKVGADDLVIALNVIGKSWSTEKLAENLQEWQSDSRRLSVLIGGPDGLSDDCLQRAQLQWSLSALTLPHPLVRVILLEQLYRAHSILINHPYHRA